MFRIPTIENRISQSAAAEILSRHLDSCIAAQIDQWIDRFHDRKEFVEIDLLDMDSSVSPWRPRRKHVKRAFRLQLLSPELPVQPSLHAGKLRPAQWQRPQCRWLAGSP
jgi:hypothetical protein